VKGLLYGSPVRSFLAKLEEMGHLDFVTREEEVDETPAEQPEDVVAREEEVDGVPAEQPEDVVGA
jgi:hypothetical protein